MPCTRASFLLSPPLPCFPATRNRAAPSTTCFCHEGLPHLGPGQWVGPPWTEPSETGRKSKLSLLSVVPVRNAGHSDDKLAQGWGQRWGGEAERSHREKENKGPGTSMDAQRQDRKRERQGKAGETEEEGTVRGTERTGSGECDQTH